MKGIINTTKIHNVSNNSCNFLILYKFRTSGFLIIICILLLSSFFEICDNYCFPVKYFYYILYNFLFSKLPILIYKITKFIKSRFSVISPSYTPMIKFSSTSTIFFQKMLLKMCFNSSKTCLIL